MTYIAPKSGRIRAKIAWWHHSVVANYSCTGRFVWSADRK